MSPDSSPMPIPHGLQAVGTDHAEFEAVAKIDDLSPGTMLRVTRGDLDLLLVNTPAGICVTDDRCPHMAAPLSLGMLEGCVVSCPLHKGRFDLSTGGVVQFPTTGGLYPDGTYHAPVTVAEGSARPSDLKAQVRAATRVRRLRYYPVRISGNDIEVTLPR